MLLLLLLPFAAGACDNDDGSRTEIWTIAPEKGVAGVTQGFGYVPAYIVRKGENSTWEATAARIEGFTFERGVQTTLRVRIDPIANPPADAPDKRYTMEEQLSRTPAEMPVDPLTFSPECEVLVASERPAGLLDPGPALRRGCAVADFPVGDRRVRLHIRTRIPAADPARRRLRRKRHGRRRGCLAGQIPVEGDAFGRREGVRRASGIDFPRGAGPSENGTEPSRQDQPPSALSVPNGPRRLQTTPDGRNLPCRPYLRRVANERMCHVTPAATAKRASCAHHHSSTTAKMQ